MNAASIRIFSRDGLLNSGRHEIGLFEDSLQVPPHPAVNDSSGIVVALRMPEFFAPVFYDKWDLDDGSPTENPGPLSRDDEVTCERIKRKNPLEKLSNAAKGNQKDEVRWIMGHVFHCFAQPALLPWYFRLIDLGRINDVFWLPKQLRGSAQKCSPGTLFAILGGEFLEPAIRDYAIGQLRKWSDADISLYLLQLIQSIQYEHDVDSPLTLFLLERAFREPKSLGLHFFWSLRSLSAMPWVEERIYRLLCCFLAFSQPVDRAIYMEAYRFTQNQIGIVRKAREDPSMDIKTVLLAEAPVRPGQRLPIDSKTIIQGYDIEHCQIMSSKQKPLWASYFIPGPVPESPSSLSMMLKLGDDLTQDQLTLQLFRVMDTMWKESNLDMRMNIYHVVPTGDKEGFIEIVPRARTLLYMQKNHGGVTEKKCVWRWLKSVSAGHVSADTIENLKYSVAGYCVATYVLGIGDRHCSNMMIQEDGHFFHIDFGHFLGHFKQAGKFFKFERETRTVYFNPALAYAINKGKAKKDDPIDERSFNQLCGKAYNILRSNGNVLISLLLSMLGTGIPELQQPSDVEYVKETLKLELDGKKAVKRFADLMQKAAKSERRVLNDVAHALSHS
jgi:phosphatidylinositol-4,5-bisphosphate 3-kinase